MYIRYTIPCDIYVVGPDPESLDVSATFEHKGYTVGLSMPAEASGRAFEVPSLPTGLRFARKAQGFQIVLNDEHSRDQTSPLAELTQTERLPDLLRIMKAVGSRVCRTIRHFGIAPEMPEKLSACPAEAAEVHSHLRKWSAIASTDGESWTPILPPRETSLIEALAGSLTSRDEDLRETVEIKVQLWPDISEALEEDNEPPPEQEFFTNTIGHLWQKNHRLAVLESIICLEIVLTQFLQQHLAISAGLPPKRIGRFLSPEMGLTARLSALLNLTLHESYLADVDVDKVLKVVEWRNRVIHKTGHLPADLRDEVVEDHIWTVLSLCRLLAERRDNIAATPAIRTIAETLRQGFEISWPMIWLKRSHRIRMDVFFYTAPDVEQCPKIFESIAKRASELFRDRDPRFNPGTHLTIHFMEYPERTLGWFLAGAVRV